MSYGVHASSQLRERSGSATLVAVTASSLRQCGGMMTNSVEQVIVDLCEFWSRADVMFVEPSPTLGVACGIVLVGFVFGFVWFFVIN